VYPVSEVRLTLDVLRSAYPWQDHVGLNGVPSYYRIGLFIISFRKVPLKYLDVSFLRTFLSVFVPTGGAYDLHKNANHLLKRACSRSKCIKATAFHERPGAQVQLARSESFEAGVFVCTAEPL
jgi:hypothetical protein